MVPHSLSDSRVAIVPSFSDLTRAGFLHTASSMRLEGRARSTDEADTDHLTTRHQALSDDFRAASIPDLDRNVVVPRRDIAVRADDHEPASAPGADQARSGRGLVTPIDDGLKFLGLGARLAEASDGPVKRFVLPHS